MSLIVQLVVGQFHAVKANDLTHPGLSGAGRVGVHIQPGRNARVVRIASHHPLRAVVHVPTAGTTQVTNILSLLLLTGVNRVANSDASKCNFFTTYGWMHGFYHGHR